MARHYISTLKENLYLRAYSQIDETKKKRGNSYPALQKLRKIDVTCSNLYKSSGELN